MGGAALHGHGVWLHFSAARAEAWLQVRARTVAARRKGGDGQPQGEAVGSTHPPTAAARSSATTKARIAGPVHEGRTRGGRGVCSRWVSLNERTGREGVSQRAPSCLAAWMVPPPGAGQRNRPPVSRGKRERRGPVAMHAPEAPAACHSANGLESAHPVVGLGARAVRSLLRTGRMRFAPRASLLGVQADPASRNFDAGRLGLRPDLSGAACEVGLVAGCQVDLAYGSRPPAPPPAQPTGGTVACGHR